MNLKAFLKEQENTGFIRAVMKDTMNRIGYLEDAGRRGLNSKTFEKYDENKEYKAEEIRGPKPQGTYFRLTIKSDQAQEEGNKVKIDDYSAIISIEYADENGNWKKVKIPEVDKEFRGAKAEVDSEIRSGFKAYSDRKEKK
jgi:hypothetical protein